MKHAAAATPNHKIACILITILYVSNVLRPSYEIRIENDMGGGDTWRYAKILFSSTRFRFKKINKKG